ncbi:glycoside hydrolase family 43 protein [Micromonospora vulcania]
MNAGNRLLSILLAAVVATGLSVPHPRPAVAGQTSLRAADPSVIRVGGTYISVQSANGGIAVRQAASTDALAAATARQVWTDSRNLGEVWAPEIVIDGGRYYIYFSAGRGAAHRMYAISSTAPASGYTAERQLALPGGKWAIDGSLFTFNGQRWFVWSGWAGDTNVEQNIYLSRMSDPLTPTGSRFIISQPRRAGNVSSATRTSTRHPRRSGTRTGNSTSSTPPTAVGVTSTASPTCDCGPAATRPTWDWYKSNGCLFGSNPATMMAGWDATLHVNGPGHHSFVLLNGDIATSPPAGPRFPLMFHAVPKGTPYSWANRYWYTGTFCWWGNTTYRRANVPGPTTDTGFSIKFFE